MAYWSIPLKIEVIIFGGFIKRICYVAIWFKGTLAPNKGGGLKVRHHLG
jgi:hypothetical protein